MTLVAASTPAPAASAGAAFALVLADCSVGLDIGLVLLGLDLVVLLVLRRGPFGFGLGLDQFPRRAFAAFRALDLELGGGQLVVDQDGDMQVIAGVEIGQVGALLVQDVEAHGGRHAHGDRPRAAVHRLHLDGAKRRDGG